METIPAYTGFEAEADLQEQAWSRGSIAGAAVKYAVCNSVPLRYERDAEQLERDERFAARARRVRGAPRR